MPGFFELPSELTDAIQQQYELHQMVGEAMRHDVQNLIESLEPEQLATLRLVFNNIASLKPNKGIAYAAYMEATCATMLAVKHNRCPGCGKDHTAELLDSAVEESAEQQSKSDPNQPTLFEAMGLDEDGTSPDELAAFGDPIQNVISNMETYNVKPINPNDLFGSVECIGCGTLSVTLEDRMRRKPGVEGCQGCQQKAKFG